MYLCEVVSPSGEYKKIYMCIVIGGRYQNYHFNVAVEGVSK